MRRSPHKITIDLCARILDVLKYRMTPHQDVECVSYDGVHNVAQVMFRNPLTDRQALSSGTLAISMEVLDTPGVLPPGVLEQVEHHKVMFQIFCSARNTEAIHDATCLDDREARTFGLRPLGNYALQVTRAQCIKRVRSANFCDALGALEQLVNPIISAFLGRKLVESTLMQIKNALFAELQLTGIVDEIDLTRTQDLRTFKITAKVNQNIITIPGKF